jgi:NADH-quinone oxidoreductase subunit C
VAGEAIPEDDSTLATTTTDVPVAEPEPEPEPQPVDEARQPLIDLLAERLGDGLVATHVEPGRDLTVRVSRDVWVRAAEVCRDELGLTYFGFLSAMDWLPSPFGRSEDGGLETPPIPSGTAFEPGTTGGNTRFQLLARLESPKAPSLGITLKCDLPSDDLVVGTWTTVFAGADWHERETAEMFGIDFAGHPNLVKLYLPGAFEGYPLRKDFPLLARDVKPWPGLVDVEPMPGEDEPTDETGAAATAGAEEAEA